MKNWLILFLAFTFGTSFGQNASSCSVPPELETAYERDIKTLAINRMQQLNSPDQHLIRIPKSWQDTIAQGLAAVLQAGFEESDSVFNRYCVHNNTGPVQIYNGLLIQVDVSYPWTQAWQNLITLTGNAYIDTLTTRYHLNISAFYDWSFADYALLHTDSLWNVYALIDSLALEPGVLGGEPDAIFGSAGRITYTKTGDARFYEFTYQFNDCFDGCDNSHTWKFEVNPDCSVEYLGFEDFWVFDQLPLPPATNCNIYTDLDEVTSSEERLFPNPASDLVFLSGFEPKFFPLHITVYNLLGQPIAEQTLEHAQQSIDVSNLATGLYLVRAGKDQPKFFNLMKK